LCGDFPPKRVRIDEIDERPLAVDLDHRQPFPVLRLELRVAGDVDLLELLAACEQDFARPLAQPAALGVVKDDARYG
jgi:hypothetical protein